MEKQWETRSLDTNFRPKQDICAVSIIVTIMFLFRNVFIKKVMKSLITRLNTSPNEKNKLRNKIFGSLYRGSVYTFLSCYGIFCISQEHYIFNFFEYTLTWKDNIIPFRVKLYYYFEMSHYISSILFIFVEPRMTDFYQMLLHHFITLTLLFISYHVNLLRYGMAIMLLHDVADPFMEIAKIFVYSGKQKIADCMFLVFAFVFIMTRCFVFPTCLIFPCFYYGLKFGLTTFFKALLCSLITLFGLNVIWSFMILRMIHTYAKYGCVKGDIRTDKVKPTKKNI